LILIKKHIDHRLVNISLDFRSSRVLFFAAVVLLAVIHWYIGKWGLANMASTRADEPAIADVLVDMAPSDPQTHYTAAVLYNKTFLPADQVRSVSEYEQAVALSPNNYLLWLDYGKALEASGDRDRAEIALKHSQQLAPNYAAVQWALGNFLIRNGNLEEGFALIRKSVDGNLEYAGSAASFAYQYFNGDLTQVRKVAGDSSRANAALASLLAKEKRMDEAGEVWQSVENPASDDSTLAAGRSLVNDLISAKKFALAMQVNASIEPDPRATPEKLHDGGFENAVKLDNASPFEWQIGPGTQPQVLQSTSQVHGGSRSLVLRFSSNDGSGLRQITQTIIVRPNTKYQLNGFYHTDLKADGKLVCQIANAVSGAVIGEVPLNTAANWTPFSAAFQVPADADAVMVRIMVKPCGTAICPANGSAWFDDLSLSAN